jgi:hypothetical protein
LKELRETRPWARLIERQGWGNNGTAVQSVLNESEELIRIFASSIRTAQANALKQKRHPSHSVQYPPGEAG